MNQKLSQVLATAWAVATLENPGFAAVTAGGVVVGWGGSPIRQSNPATNDVVAISAGGLDCLFLLRDGSVAGYGLYGIGQFTNVVTVPPGVTSAVAVAAGADQCLALRADGTVVAWDASGLLAVPPELTNVVAISLASDLVTAWRADGTVAFWGDGIVVPSDLSNIVAVAAGFYIDNDETLRAALKPDGTVVAWDSNGAYVQVPANWTNVVAISGGSGEFLALKADGTAVGWNDEPSALLNLSNVVAIAASTGNDDDISLALLADGTVVGWGFDFGMGPDVPLGLSNVVAVASGWAVQLALAGGGPPFLTSHLLDRTAVMAGTSYFRVEATGQWPLSYQWQFDGTNLPGATSQVLCLTNLQPSQAGPYSVTVKNAAGAVTSDPARLSVVPVFISTSPFDQVDYVGETATFSVNAQGFGALSYQWGRDGADIDGATNALLVLTNVQSAQAGVYSVDVRNAFGGATSAGALLMVLPAIITAQQQDEVTFVGGSATFSVSSQGSEPLSYRWTFNDVTLDGATNSTLSLSNVQPAQAGAYLVTVSDRFGTLTSNSAKLSVVRVASWGVANQNQVPLNLSPPVVSVAGEVEALALKANGSVVTWGDDGIQALVPGDLTNVVAVSGGWFDVALRANGAISVWGDIYYAQPPNPPALSNVVAISARYGHGLALTAEGQVVAWGDNYQGASTVPPDLADVVAIAAGGYHSLALRADGQVVAWGDNTRGQTNVPAGLSGVVGIAAGNWHNLALKADGTVVAFGLDAYGQSDVPIGLSNVVGVACGGFLSMALKADGTLSAWGIFDDGYSTPVAVPSGLKDVIAMAGGDAFCLAIVGNGPPSLSVPVSISSQTAGHVSVSVPTQCGRVCRLEYKAALSDTNWTALPLVAGNGGVLELIDPTPASAQRFYRVRRW